MLLDATTQIADGEERVSILKDEQRKLHGERRRDIFGKAKFSHQI